MPVDFVSKPLEGHPLTELQYELTPVVVEAHGQTLNLVALADVERAIDQVFNWLDASGRDANEIERLAPYFGAVWPSALALTDYLLHEKNVKNLVGTRVLELGCGLAIPSMMAARSGADVSAMDNHPDVPRFLQVNVQQNEPLSLRFIASSEPQSANSIEMNRHSFDLIMASDILYEARLAEHFANEITAYSKPSATAIIADPGRPHVDTFIHAMTLRGWKYELIKQSHPINIATVLPPPVEILVLKFVRQ